MRAVVLNYSFEIADSEISNCLNFEFASQQIVSSFFTEVVCEICDALWVNLVTDAEKKKFCLNF